MQTKCHRFDRTSTRPRIVIIIYRLTEKQERKNAFKRWSEFTTSFGSMFQKLVIAGKNAHENCTILVR